MTPRVLFLHGTRGGPFDRTASYLSKWFVSSTPQLPTSDYRASVDVAAQWLTDKTPDVLVGESFGAAVAYALVERGLWRGPTVMLCPAVQRIRERFGESNVHLSWSLGSPLTIVHGTLDDVVPEKDVEELARLSPHTRLVWVEDDHGMTRIVDGTSEPQLNTLIDEVM